jgi:hypothetical protein
MTEPEIFFLLLRINAYGVTETPDEFIFLSTNGYITPDDPLYVNIDGSEEKRLNWALTEKGQKRLLELSVIDK